MKTDKIRSAYSYYLQDRKNTQTFRKLVALHSENSRYVTENGRRYINFSSNDYLGLRHHKALKDKAAEWTDRMGVGCGASRLVTGNLDVYRNLEQKLAQWKGCESALIMATGYQCNTSVLPALMDARVLGAEPLVFTDKLIHASMHMGCRAAKIKQIRFQHNSVDHLEQQLLRHADSNRPKFILIESVYSMDGDMAPIEAIYRLKIEHDAFLIVDEAHSSGVCGPQGRGLAECADVIIGTCGKAMGSYGAFIACSQEIREYLINACDGIIYSTGLPPSVLGAIDAALDILPTMEAERQHLQDLATHFRNELDKLGLDYGNSCTQIVPVLLGESQRTLKVSELLKESGIWVTAIRPPTVPVRGSRLRFALSAAHTQQDIDTISACLKAGLAVNPAP